MYSSYQSLAHRPVGTLVPKAPDGRIWPKSYEGPHLGLPRNPLSFCRSWRGEKDMAISLIETDMSSGIGSYTLLRLIE